MDHTYTSWGAEIEFGILPSTGLEGILEVAAQFGTDDIIAKVPQYPCVLLSCRGHSTAGLRCVPGLGQWDAGRGLVRE